MKYCVNCGTAISDEQSRNFKMLCVTCFDESLNLPNTDRFPSNRDQRRPPTAEDAKGDEYEDQ